MTKLVEELKELLRGETNFIANASNFSALIFNSMENLNWAGFYFATTEQSLVLGPFQGKPACLRIAYGKGVCGAAALERKIQIVADVHEFAGHIACDAASHSEIVLPIIYNDRLLGVLDIDSPIKNRFSQNDAQLFSEMLALLIEASDCDRLWKYYNK